MLSTILLLGLGLTGLQAQESINASGCIASGAGGSVSYSMGQLMYQNSAAEDGIIAEGVQQPFEISVATANDETNGINLSINAFPNPVTDDLILTVDNVDTSNLNFQLYDMHGKLLQTRRIDDTQTCIAMSKFGPAIYFVKIVQKDKELMTFKVIKF